MSIKASVKLIDTDSEINKKILEALYPQVDKYFKKVFEKIRINLSAIVINAIISSPEYQELINGQLKAEFGLPDPETRISNILNVWKNITFEYTGIKNNGKQLIGNIKLSMIKSDFSDVLSLSDASLITEKGSTLNWLEWLLLFGDKTIIKDYNVVLGPNSSSRTGMAIMKGVVSGKWSVPSSFSGTSNNNWITRAIDGAEEQINKLISDSLKA